MKIEVCDNEIRIKGKNHGADRHIKIYVSEQNGNDRYSISLIRDGFESGCLPTITINKDFIVARNNSLGIGEQIIN